MKIPSQMRFGDLYQHCPRQTEGPTRLLGPMKAEPKRLATALETGDPKGLRSFSVNRRRKGNAFKPAPFRPRRSGPATPSLIGRRYRPANPPFPVTPAPEDISGPRREPICVPKPPPRAGGCQKAGACLSNASPRFLRRQCCYFVGRGELGIQ